ADIGFNWSQAAGFIAEFCSLGGTIVKRIWVPSGTQDYSDVVAEMPVHGVDGVVAATGPETVVALATRYPGLRGNLSRKLLVGAIAINPPIGQLGRRISGVLLAGSFLQLPGVAGRTYLADLRRSFPGLKFAGTGFDIYYHDGVAAVAQALAVVQGDLSHGERRFMAALARVRLRSPSGSFRLDSNRQAVGPNYLVRMDGSLYRRVGGVEHTFAGYFTPDDPPPSQTTPLCRHGRPPPGARRSRSQRPGEASQALTRSEAARSEAAPDQHNGGPSFDGKRLAYLAQALLAPALAETHHDERRLLGRCQERCRLGLDQQWLGSDAQGRLDGQRGVRQQPARVAAARSPPRPHQPKRDVERPRGPGPQLASCPTPLGPHPAHQPT